MGILYPLLRLMSRAARPPAPPARDSPRGGCGWKRPTPTTPPAARAVPLRAAVLDAELWDAARRAFVLANTKRLAVRAVALTLDRLMEAEAQLELWGGTAGQRGSGQQQHT